MERAFIFTGKVNGKESYQLLVNLSYVFRTYDGTEERAASYEEISDVFARTILKQHSNLELGIMNGYSINPETIEMKEIPKLEEAYVSQLKEAIRTKLISLAPRLTYPVYSRKKGNNNGIN